MKSFLFSVAAILGVSASAQAGYYDPFVFHVQGSCADSRGIFFHQSAPWFRVDLGRDSSGRIVYADMDLQLNPNGSYWMSYNEVVITKYLPNGGYEGKELFRTTVAGQWGVYGQQLALGGFATAMPTVIHDHGGVAQGFELKFFNSIHDGRLKAARAIFGAVYSKFGPRGMSVKEYCHLP